MYCAFAVVVASVVYCNAPAPAGAVASTTKFTAPPGLVSSVVQPCVFVGVTTTVLAALAPATASASVNDTKTPVPLNSFLTCSPLFAVGPVPRPRRTMTDAAVRCEGSALLAQSSRTATQPGWSALNVVM